MEEEGGVTKIAVRLVNHEIIGGSISFFPSHTRLSFYSSYARCEYHFRDDVRAPATFQTHEFVMS